MLVSISPCRRLPTIEMGLAFVETILALPAFAATIVTVNLMPGRELAGRLPLAPRSTIFSSPSPYRYTALPTGAGWCDVVRRHAHDHRGSCPESAGQPREMRSGRACGAAALPRRWRQIRSRERLSTSLPGLKQKHLCFWNSPEYGWWQLFGSRLRVPWSPPDNHSVLPGMRSGRPAFPRFVP